MDWKMTKLKVWQKFRFSAKLVFLVIKLAISKTLETSETNVQIISNFQMILIMFKCFSRYLILQKYLQKKL